MQFLFTPAAERALKVATDWTNRNDSAALALPEVLMGLLSESECRAAQMLAQAGITPAAVEQHWNLSAPAELNEGPPSIAYSRPLVQALKAAEARLWDYQQPLSLATEHILLGILAHENEVSAWLQQFGMHADVLEAEVHRLTGFDRSPLELPIEELPLPQHLEEIASVGPTRTTTLPAASTDEPDLVLYRILDAAANRASEGLRVVEDYVRFALDDPHLTQQLKLLRHGLSEALSGVSTPQRLAARETLADVGAEIKTAGELVRTDLSAVLTASFQRLQQALRSLEEFSKIANPAAAARIERLRYLSYTLERAVHTTGASLSRLRHARLYVLLDGRKSVNTFRQQAENLVRAGVHIIQLRDKSLDDRTLLDRAKILRSVTTGTPTLFVMNDRPDLAVLSDADGVHVGQEELSVKEARRVVGTNRLIGVSTHDIQQARQAVLDGADYIGVGPAFPSQTKAFADFPGLRLMQAVSNEIRLPAFLIGGITLGNLDRAMAAGAQRVAIGAAIVEAPDVAQASAEFLARLSSKSS